METGAMRKSQSNYSMGFCLVTITGACYTCRSASAPACSGDRMKLRHSADTDVGKTRDHNEDSFGVGAPDQAERMGDLLVICDGMGGHAAGEVASKIGVETILAIYYGEASEDRARLLEKAFEQANEQIYARGNGSMAPPAWRRCCCTMRCISRTSATAAPT